MSHNAYELALIRRDQLLREAADRRLATESTSRVEGEASVAATRRSSRLPRLEWLVRASHVSTRFTARGH
jgi:hypothetical protein